MRKTNVTSAEKIFAITEAARNQCFTDEIDEIETLSYSEMDKQGEVKVYEDRFDYIDTTVIPVTVRFIGGTGCKNPSCAIDHLTKESIDMLYNCIDNI